MITNSSEATQNTPGGGRILAWPVVPSANGERAGRLSLSARGALVAGASALGTGAIVCAIVFLQAFQAQGDIRAHATRIDEALERRIERPSLDRRPTPAMHDERHLQHAGGIEAVRLDLQQHGAGTTRAVPGINRPLGDAGSIDDLVNGLSARVEQLDAQWRRIAWQAVLAVGLMAFAAALAGAAAMQPTAGAIGRLRRTVQAICGGHDATPVPVEGPLDVAELAREVDLLASRIASLKSERDHAARGHEVVAHRLREVIRSLQRRLGERATQLSEVRQRLEEALIERQSIELKLDRLVRHDVLTGLPNRAMCTQGLKGALARGRRHGRRVAMLLVDVDRFKHVNDSLGHGIGDAVLQACARRLRTSLREMDLVCRLGGDEFAIVVEDVDTADNADTVAAKIVASFQEPLLLDGGAEVFVSVSVGVALAGEQGETVADMLRKAEVAMYFAKSEGRNTWAQHSMHMSSRSDDTLALETALRHALERQEFEVVYQPRVDASSRRLVGMEVLLRWHSGKLGPVSPERFIPVAEDSGMIEPIGRWVVSRVFSQLAEWQRQGIDPGVMAINVSAHQLRNPGFVDFVVSEARAAGIAPGSVELELTESSLVVDPESAAATLARLREHGFGIAIDDFGKGYSSLMHLKHFPATKLKIDRAFVTDIDRNRDDVAIAASIVALGNALGIRITAEGVETATQLKVLDGLGCDEYQGYLFGQPLSRDDMQALLTAQPGMATPQAATAARTA